MEITFHYHLVNITKYLPEDFNIVFCFLRTYFKNPSRLTLVLKCSAEENLALPLFCYLIVRQRYRWFTIVDTHFQLNLGFVDHEN